MRLRKSPYFACFFLSALLPTSCGAQEIDFPSSELQLDFVPISTDFNNPWSFIFLGDGSILVSEKAGELYHIATAEETARPVKGLPEIYVRGQGGLMDLEKHPEYDKNGWIYISYGSSDNKQKGGNTTVARARFTPQGLEDFEVVFRATPDSRKGQHWGGRLEFDRAGYLYISVGDRGARDHNPQSLKNHSGKIHRIHDDGRIPLDNPFVGERGAMESIFSYGHRNPQGMAMHPFTGQIWIHEHGPKGGDELNIIGAGKNYGWPEITYGRNYSGTVISQHTEKEGMEQPVYYWLPSIAPCGMTFIDSDVYPEWRGSLLIGSLKFSYIHRCTLQENKVIAHEKIAEKLGRIRTVRQGQDGYLYASVEGKGLYKLVPQR